MISDTTRAATRDATRVKQASIRLPAGFGGRVRAARQRRGWTRAELAAAVAARPSTIASWEGGGAFWIRPEQLHGLAAALGVGAEWLLTRPYDADEQRLLAPDADRVAARRPGAGARN